MDKENGSCLHKDLVFVAEAAFKNGRNEYYYHCIDCGEQLSFDKDQEKDKKKVTVN